MSNDLVCEITEYMNTYILTKDGVLLGIPGYTCADVIFNRKDDTVDEIVLTRRGGAFSDGMETMYLNPDRLEKELNQMFKGKKVNYYERKD